MDEHYYVSLYYSLCGVFRFAFHLYFQYHNHLSHVKQAETKKKKERKKIPILQIRKGNSERLSWPSSKSAKIGIQTTGHLVWPPVITCGPSICHTAIGLDILGVPSIPLLNLSARII